jgi:hypothetical protein
MSSNPIFDTNPFMSQWLSAANSAAGAWRGFWTAEFARQQAALVAEFNRQALRFWTAPLKVAPFSAPAPVPTEAAPAPIPAEAVTAAIAAAPLEALAAAPAEAVASEPEAEPIVARRPRAAKPAALRTAAQRRKATAKRPAAPAGKSPRVTRH